MSQAVIAYKLKGMRISSLIKKKKVTAVNFLNGRKVIACENSRFSSLLGTFRMEERLRFSDRNAKLMM